jgi:Ca2+-binding EF-hand superfamily protein
MDYQFLIERFNYILTYEIDFATNKGFEEMDTDKSGEICINEFYPKYLEFFKNLQLPEPTREEVQQVFEQLDLDKSKGLNKNEFKTLTINLIKSSIARFEAELNKNK